MLAGRHEPSEARIYNLGSADRMPLRQVIERVANEIELKAVLRFGARDYARYEPMFLGADISRARQEMNWTPRHNLAHAVWQLARDSFPQLTLQEPRESI